jgi:hypothetical protein
VTGNVLILPVVTSLPIPVDRVLDAASDAGLEKCVIIGEDADGGFYFSSSVSGGPDILWLLEEGKLKLLAAGGSFPE